MELKNVTMRPGRKNGGQKYLAWIRTKKEGDIVTVNEACEVVGWVENTFWTYVGKRKLLGIREYDENLFIVGAAITDEEFWATFTQKNPGV